VPVINVDRGHVVQFVDNETESENEILCTPKPKKLRKSNKKKVL
jgi:hypothetical protein